MSQAELDEWKRKSQPVPNYVSDNYKSIHEKLLSGVDEQLAKKRIDYIVLLFNQLTDSEKQALLK